ncbi:hypothetical protein L0F63_002797 [Massospora cicadina]|nr:hypothetical protein L0F63_002797 [Massospora cicadina]
MKLITLCLGVSLGYKLDRFDRINRLCQGIDIRELTISKAQELQLHGKLSAFHLTKCYLERIKVLNPILHAVIETNPDALRIAKQRDRRLMETGRFSGSLHGIPILVKDNIATGDKMETTAGSLALVGMKPIKDATVISRLRKAGAIILGKANLSELSGITTYGSSSGSAVGVAANLCMAALGTETDGSIIAPASIASVVGFKPTVGSIPMDGIIRVTASQDSVGPMARTTTDTNILYSAMLGGPTKPLKLPTGLRVGILRHNHLTYIRKAVKLIQQISISKLNLNLTFPEGIIERESIVLYHEFNHQLSNYLRGVNNSKFTSVEDIVNFNRVKDPTHPQQLLEAIRPYHKITNQTYINALHFIKRKSKLVLDELLELNQVEVVAAPTISPNFNKLCAISGYPVIVVPAGYDEYGIPFGMLFYSKPNMEHLLLSLANAFEKLARKRRLPRYLL